MPKLNEREIQVLFFGAGALLGVVAPFGAVGILVAMLLLRNN